MRFRKFLLIACCLISSAVLGGCGFIPMSGPASLDIRNENTTVLPFAVVKLNPEVLQVLEKYEPNGLSGNLADTRPPSSIKFGIGDVISVTIFEAAAGGLYVPLEAGVRPGNFVNLPDQAVDNDGNITVPYAGRIRAAGRTNVQVQEDILAQIKKRAIDPQVVVTSSQQRSSLVSVFGEVRTPVRFPMPSAGAQDRITDAITRAGGISGAGWETWVVLERGGKRATVPFGNLVYFPASNAFVQPGDRLYLYREPMKFIAFGATGQQGEFNFDAWRINLTQAVAKARGLLDLQADPASVFLYRREPREVAQRARRRLLQVRRRFRADRLQRQLPGSGRIFHRHQAIDASVRRALRRQRCASGCHEGSDLHQHGARDRGERSEPRQQHPLPGADLLDDHRPAVKPGRAFR